MKKAILPIFFLAFISFFTTNLQAGTVSIDSTSELRRGSACNYTQRIVFNLFGSSNGYNVGDTITVEIYFGDGTTDLYKDTIANSNGFVSAWFPHNYSSGGQYSVKYILTGPDLAADTVVIPNAVVFSDSCGNISGQVYADVNNNCILDGSETPLAGVQVKAYQGSQYVYSDWTDTNGYYYIDVPVGPTYTISTSATYGYNTICPASGSHTISSVPSSGNDFAIDCGSGFDLYPHASGWSVPGQTLNLYLNVYNSFCQSQSGSVKLIFSDSLYSYGNLASTPPNSINGDTLEWNFTSLSNGWQNMFNVNVGAYTDTTAQIGDTVCVTVIVDPMAGDSNATNNIKTFCIPVRTSYDPNIKVSSPLGIGDSGRVAPNIDLTYTVHFQNTGTAQAYNVYILDTLDVSTLDLNTIEILGSSHQMGVNLISPTQNVLKFRFDDIMLPDSNTNEPASHGWVTYKIKQQPNLTNGTTIQNSASIYFDYNPAVVTNFTLNTIDDQIVGVKSVKAVKEQRFANIYPNPAEEVLHIDFAPNIEASELSILDINGKLIRKVNTLHPNNQLNVSDLKPGIYLIEMRTQSGERQSSKVLINK